MDSDRLACNRARWILAGTAAILIFLFAHSFRAQLKTANDVRPEAPGQGVVIRGDGLGYYAWLRSPLIDGDWEFDNEFDDYNPASHGVPAPRDRTPLGKRSNPWSVGPACVWTPAVATAHAILKGLGSGGAFAPDGYTPLYQFAVGGTTAALSIMTLLLIFSTARNFAGPVESAFAASVGLLATPVVAYSVIDPSMGHGPGSAALAFFVWYWLRTWGRRDFRNGFVLGLLLGVAGLMRWQLLAFAVLPVVEGIVLVLSGVTAVRGYLASAATAPIGVGVGIAPQLIAWKWVYGTWFVRPMELAERWFDPALGDVLFSWDRGFFTWTPWALVATAILTIRLTRPIAGRPLLALAVAYVGQIYIIAAISGVGVFLGSAFGHRSLTESCVLLIPGVALMMARLGPTGRYVLAALGCGCVFWNLMMLGMYRNGTTPSDRATAPDELVAAAGRYAYALPIETVFWTFATLALGFHIYRGLRAVRLTPSPALSKSRF